MRLSPLEDKFIFQDLHKSPVEQMSRPFFSTTLSQNVHEETVPTGKQLLTSARTQGQQDELALDRETVHSQNDSPNTEGHRLPLTDNLTQI